MRGTGGLGSRGGKDFDRVLDLRDKKKKAIMIPVFVAAYTAEEIPPTVSKRDPLEYARRLVNPQNLSTDNFSKTMIIDGIDKKPFFKDNISFSAEVPDNHVLDVNVPKGTYTFFSSGWWYKIPIEEQHTGSDIIIQFGGKNIDANFETEVKYTIKV